MKLNSKKIITGAIFFYIVFAFNTYVVQNFFQAGEFGAEGIPTILGMIVFLSVGIKAISTQKLHDNFVAVLYFTYVTYLILITALQIINFNQSPMKFIFIYQYIPILILLFSYKNIDDLDCEFLFLVICIFSAISAIFGIFQFFGVSEIIPIDINRARGLSRSTLNFSSLMFLGYISACNLRNLFYRNLFIILIFLGALASQSRGAILAIVIFTVINFYNNKKFYKAFLIYFLVGLLSLLIIQIKYDVLGHLHNYSSYNELVFRFKNTATVSADDNSLRVARYLQFFKDFNPFGGGIGSTGPGANRLQESVHFESFILNIISQGGMVALLFWPLFLLVLYLKFKPIRSNLWALILAYLFMMGLQQTYETPSVNLLAWIIILLYIVKKNKNLN